jgi:hypothetical protein
MGGRTKSGIEHIQSHLVALCGTSDSDQALVTTLLGLVDLDDTAAEVTYLVNFGSTLADDGANHVVGNVDLLGQWLTGHGSAHRGRGCWRSTARGRLLGAANEGSGLVGACATVSGLGSGREVHWGLGDGSGSWLAVQVGNTVCTTTGTVGVRVVTLESLGVAVLAAGGLRNVWNNLHTTRDSTGRTAAASGICRSRGTAVTFRQLLDQGDCDIVGSNVNGICNTENDKGSFRGQGEASIRGV